MRKRGVSQSKPTARSEALSPKIQLPSCSAPSQPRKVKPINVINKMLMPMGYTFRDQRGCTSNTARAEDRMMWRYRPATNIACVTNRIGNTYQKLKPCATQPLAVSENGNSAAAHTQINNARLSQRVWAEV